MTEQNTNNTISRTFAEGTTLQHGTPLLRRSPRLLLLYNDQARRKNVNMSACKSADHSVTGAVSVVGSRKSQKLNDRPVDFFTCRRSPRLSLLVQNKSKDDITVSTSVTGSRKTINSSNGSNKITGLRRSQRLIQLIQKLHDPISGILVKGKGNEVCQRNVVGREDKSMDTAVNNVSSGLRKAVKPSNRFSTLVHELNDLIPDCPNCEKGNKVFQQNASNSDSMSTKNTQIVDTFVVGLQKCSMTSNEIGNISNLMRSSRFLLQGNGNIFVDKCSSERFVNYESDKPVDEIFNKLLLDCAPGIFLDKENIFPCKMNCGFDKGKDDISNKSFLNCVPDGKLDNESLVSWHTKEYSKKHEASVEAWSEDQEMSLQRAYFATKPTPRFWKKVSKMVPGKSAIDCYNKVHADHITPPPPMPSSRAKIANSSLVDAPSLSPSKLLLNPCDPKIRRLRCNRQKGRLVHKTIRKLLQNDEMMKQKLETDLFNILEPSINSTTEEPHPSVRLCSPSPLCKKPGFSSSLLMDLASPHVLKPIKNRALHEKYIDQLHQRDAKRKAACVRLSKFNMGKESYRLISNPPYKAVAAAKNVMVSQVEDAIYQLHHLHPEPVDFDFLDDCDC